MSLNSEFIRQFNKREDLISPYGVIQVVDVYPASLVDSVPILVHPGFGETPKKMAGSLEQVYLGGRRALTVVPSRRIGTIDSRFADFPEVEAHKAQTLLYTLDQKDIKKVDLLTHSGGALAIAITASIYPERFRNMVLVAPAGLMGHDSLFRLQWGYYRHAWGKLGQEESTVDRQGLIRDVFDGNLMQNISFVSQEALAIAEMDIHPLLMKAKAAGVRIAILCGEKDPVFPLDRVRNHLSKLAGSPNYGFDIFATHTRGHSLHSNPQEVMDQMLGLLDSLELNP